METTIYALADPRSPLRVRWVGRTKHLANRVKAHTNCFRSGHNTTKVHWLQQLKRLGLKPEVITLATVSSDQADAEERRFTEQFRASGHPLLNIALGRRHSLNSRRKMSHQRQGSRHPRWRHDVDEAVLVELFSAGMSCKEIGLKLHVGAGTVHRRLRAAGIQTRRFIAWRKRKRNNGAFA